ncbi:sorting nexin-7-like [Orbicella faveolata]|uniref:sorting nexin-7-like n=1 Tax=Orbicella faveolata TaxID=48498 RepID=UPI0009E2BA2F|nr:sorting nexin-7-like [Orbicella faveolata]XP_020617073.1 sorting nexin-7-like [Orbicella faveolata]XP_020617074.1 sorting nexin-7-like [Orbicella faveolata]
MYRRRRYRLFRPRYDWSMIRDQVGETAYGNAYLEIEVKNPRTHIENEKAQYTDYEIDLKTNHPAFPLFHSRVRRRYSEFVWLRNKLGLDDMVMMHVPRLPRKQLIGRFKDSFLQKRQQGLERFLNSLASRNTFANDPAMLVFLQTGLSKHQMDYYLKTRTPGGIRSLVLRLHDKKLRKDEEQRRPRTKTFSAEYPLTEKSQTLKSKSYGKGWSSYHSDDLFGFGGDRTEVDTPTYKDMKKCRSISCIAYPSGLLTLPTIPGSCEDGIESMGSTSAAEGESQIEEHPLSRSWHGTPRDEIDLVLEDYEIIPFDPIAQVGVDVDTSDEFFDMDLDLDYVDINPDMESGREHRFDY